MEIHAPEKPVHSFRDFGVHLAMVTLGILIALGFEQVVQWHHHRQLVAEANELLLSEIRENRQTLERQVQNFPRFEAGIAEGIEAVSGLLAGKAPADFPTGAFFYQAPLRDTSWITAQTAGALTYMPYDNVHTYASAYYFQSDYNATQRRTAEIVDEAASFIAKGSDGTSMLPRLSPAELQAIRGNLMHADVAMRIQQNKIDRLLQEYDKVLSAHGERGAGN